MNTGHISVYSTMIFSSRKCEIGSVVILGLERRASVAVEDELNRLASSDARSMHVASGVREPMVIYGISLVSRVSIPNTAAQDGGGNVA